jgi:hypothetical protein
MSDELKPARAVVMMAFYMQDLRDLLEHLEMTGYKESELNHLRDVLKNAREI